MKSINPILEISIASENNEPTSGIQLETDKDDVATHSLILGKENKLHLFVKNISKFPVTFQALLGIPSMKGSDEPEKPTTLFLDFGVLLSRADLASITLQNADWTHATFEKEKDSDNNTKGFFYLALSPKKEKELGPEESIRFELIITPKSRPDSGYLSVQVDNLKTVAEQPNPPLDQVEFLFKLESKYFNDQLQLVHGFLDSDMLYIPSSDYIINHFSLFIMNTGPKITFPDSKGLHVKKNFHKTKSKSQGLPHLKIQFLNADVSSLSAKEKIGDNPKKDITINGNPITNGTGGYWEIGLSEVWSTAEALTFDVKMSTSHSEKERVEVLRIAYFNLPDYRDGAIFIPIRQAKRKVIGTPANSIKITPKKIDIG